MDAPRKAAYLLGARHLSFSADVTVVDGTVSHVGYALEPVPWIRTLTGYSRVASERYRI